MTRCRASALAAAALALALAGCTAATTSSPSAVNMAPLAPQDMSLLGSYLAAHHAQAQYEYGDAAAFMNRALDLDPNNGDLLRRTFLFEVGAGHVGAAAPLAGRLDQGHATGLPLLVQMVEDLKKGAWDSAIARAGSSSRDGAERYAVPLLLAWAHAGQRDYTGALGSLGTSEEWNSLFPLKVLHQALLDDAAGKAPEAEAAYRQVLGSQASPSWRVVELFGNFLERQGRGADARDLYRSYAATAEDETVVVPALNRIAKGIVPPPAVATAQAGAAEALFDLASLLNQHETADAALIFVRLSLDLAPDFPLAQMQLADIEDNEHHPATALALYRSVDPASPLSWAARLQAALMADELDRTDEAIGELKALAAEAPTQSEPLVILGDVLRNHDRFAEAASDYDAAIVRAGGPAAKDWHLFYSRGVAFERAGDWPHAESDLKHALALAPDEPTVLNYLGYSWIDRGENLDSALKMVEHAVELRPEDGYMVDSLGWAFFRLGRYSRATELLERATELLPEDPTINDHLGDAYWRTGRVAEARFQWQRALQFQPEADEAKTIEAKLDHGLDLPPPGLSGG